VKKSLSVWFIVVVTERLEIGPKLFFAGALCGCEIAQYCFFEIRDETGPRVEWGL